MVDPAKTKDTPPQPAPTAELTLEERKARAAEELEKIRQKRAAAAEKRQLAIDEARIKYEAELGPEGEAFALLDVGAEGFVVLKPIPTGLVLFKEFRAKVQKDEMTLEAAQKYVLPSVVHPDRPGVLEILSRRPVLHDDLVVLLHGLYGRNEAADRGKS
jgi:hypothetical protein